MTLARRIWRYLVATTASSTSPGTAHLRRALAPKGTLVIVAQVITAAREGSAAAIAINAALVAEDVRDAERSRQVGLDRSAH